MSNDPRTPKNATEPCIACGRSVLCRGCCDAIGLPASEATPVSVRKDVLPRPQRVPRQLPRWCYCGEESAWPWIGSPVCRRCAAIRDRVERPGMGDDVLLKLIQAQLTKAEQAAAKQAEREKKRRAREKKLEAA